MAAYKFYVLTAVVIKSSVFWDITPCGPFKVNPRFGETYLRFLLFHAVFLLGLLFNHEDVGDMFSETSIDYAALYRRRWNPSYGSMYRILKFIAFKETAIFHKCRIYHSTQITVFDPYLL
jgi:hypothetical protein